jgi:hypothetical protein
MLKSLESIKLNEKNISFLDMFQYQVDETGQLRLSMLSKDDHPTADVQPVKEQWPSHCVPSE